MLLLLCRLSENRKMQYGGPRLFRSLVWLNVDESAKIVEWEDSIMICVRVCSCVASEADFFTIDFFITFWSVFILLLSFVRHFRTDLTKSYIRVLIFLKSDVSRILDPDFIAVCDYIAAQLTNVFLGLLRVHRSSSTPSFEFERARLNRLVKRIAPPLYYDNRDCFQSFSYPF